MSRTIDVVLWILSSALLASLVLLSLGPGGGRSGIWALDKLWHGVGYGALTGAWLLAAAWRPGRGPGVLPHAGPPIAFSAAALGGLLEILQGMIGRSADPFDWVANLVGIFVVSLAWMLARRLAG